MVVDSKDPAPNLRRMRGNAIAAIGNMRVAKIDSPCRASWSCGRLHIDWQVSDNRARPRTIASEKALVLPPPGGPSIVSVVEQKRGNGVDQIHLAVHLVLRSRPEFSEGRSFSAQAAPIRAQATRSYKMVSESGLLRARCSASVPGVRMAQVGNLPAEQLRSVRLCLRHKPLVAIPASTPGSRSARAAPDQTQARNFGMIQVRLRLCDARATERQLLGVMYGYTVIGTFNGEIWNPFGVTQRGRPDASGSTGNPIYPDEGRLSQLADANRL
jgi:hypothetical protein